MSYNSFKAVGGENIQSWFATGGSLSKSWRRALLYKMVVAWVVLCIVVCGCATKSELCENSYSEFCARLYSGAVVDLDEWEKWVQMGRTELLPDEIVCDKRVSTVLRIAIVEKYGDGLKYQDRDALLWMASDKDRDILEELTQQCSEQVKNK